MWITNENTPLGFGFKFILGSASDESLTTLDFDMYEQWRFPSDTPLDNGISNNFK